MVRHITKTLEQMLQEYKLKKKKKKKKSFLCDKKILFSFFVHRSILIFFIVVLQSKVFLLLRLNLCKASVRGSHFSKTAGFFPATLCKMNTVKGIFQGFYLDFKQFSIVCNISRRLSNGKFRKF